MTEYKSIIAYLADITTAPATLTLALRVARQQGAHVEALHVRADPTSAIPLIGEGMSATMVEEMLSVAESRAAERAAELRRLFNEIAAEQGVPVSTSSDTVSTSWHEETGREEDVLAALARLSDLVVMARPSTTSDAGAILSLNAALLESGRPLLLAPPAAVEAPSRSVAVFWNGSVEASRAITFALPFLKQARQVTILSAREENRAVPGDVVKYLAWHGVAAEAKAFAAGPQVGQTLLAEAGRLNADLIVMGAYTHSRLRQLILGGVTRHMLQTASVPVLFSH